MRTRTEIRNELADLASALEPYEAEAIDEPFGVQMMRDSLERRQSVLLEELRHAEESDLFVILDGQPVVDHAVDVDFLVRVLSPLDKAAAAIAQALEDAATRAGVIPAAIRERSTVRLRATFAGSFGMALTGPATDEQLLLPLDESDMPSPLFDRAIGRLMAIVEAGHDPDAFDQEILEEIGDLGQRAASHVIDLAKSVSGVGTPIQFLWTEKGGQQRRVFLTPLVASRLQQVLTEIDITEVEEPIAGRLVEASLPRRTFGIELDDGSVVRGSVSADVAHRIEEFFGQAVRGTMLVTRTRSTVSDRHAEKFHLLRFAGPVDG